MFSPSKRYQKRDETQVHNPAFSVLLFAGDLFWHTELLVTLRASVSEYSSVLGRWGRGAVLFWLYHVRANSKMIESKRRGKKCVATNSPGPQGPYLSVPAGPVVFLGPRVSQSGQGHGSCWWGLHQGEETEERKLLVWVKTCQVMILRIPQKPVIKKKWQCSQRESVKSVTFGSYASFKIRWLWTPRDIGQEKTAACESPVWEALTIEAWGIKAGSNVSSTEGLEAMKSCLRFSQAQACPLASAFTSCATLGSLHNLSESHQ